MSPFASFFAVAEAAPRDAQVEGMCAARQPAQVVRPPRPTALAEVDGLFVPRQGRAAQRQLAFVVQWAARRASWEVRS